MASRVLITGLSSLWGGRIARALEQQPSIELIVGLDRAEPSVALERTEFVRADETYSILSRLVQATEVDTVVHAGLVVDSTLKRDRTLYERNVIGSLNLLAAAGAPASTVRSVVVKSSTLVYGAGGRDPAWFGEGTPRSRPARTPLERSLLEVETYLDHFTRDNPTLNVTVLRFADVLGPDNTTPISRALSLPLVPKIAGFDPQLQFVDADDVVRAIEFALHHDLRGVYNVAGDGRLPWTEILAIAGKHPLLLPPVLTGSVSAPLGRLRILRLPPELLDLLRFGRGVDNRRLKQAGFAYCHTTAGAIERLARAGRLRAAVGEPEPAYRYDRDVETFFRHSPAIVRGAARGDRPGPAGEAPVTRPGVSTL